MGRFELLNCKSGNLEINESTASVLLAGASISLPKLSYQLLLTLVRHSPKVVSTQQLIQEVWDNKVVSEDTIQQRIKLLRQALQESAKEPTYIATVRGQGYQFIGEIQHLSSELASENSKNNNRLLTFFGLFASASIIFVLITILSTQKNIRENLLKSDNPQAVESISNFIPERHSENKSAIIHYFNGKDYLNHATKESNKAATLQFKKAVSIDPYYALAYTGLAIAYSQEIMFNPDNKPALIKKSLQAAKQAIALKPDFYESHNAIARAHLANDNRASAKESYRELLKLHPNHATALNNLAFFERLDNNHKEALKLILRLINKSPRRALAYSQVGQIYSSLGYYSESEVWFKKALNLEPQRRHTQFSLCRLQIESGNLDSAEQTCSDMLSWDTEDAWGYEWVGELALLRGDISKAILNYRKAMELDSNYSKFRYASLIIGTPRELEENVQQMLEESLRSMHKYYREDPNDTGSILNLCDYYAAMGKNEDLYHWMKVLINTRSTDHRNFIVNSPYAQYQQNPTFLNLVQQQKQKQLQLKQSIDPKFIIYPNQVNDQLIASLQAL